MLSQGVAVILFTIIVYASGELECVGNEVRSNCATSCPPTCEKPRKLSELSCTDGCVCKPGYIRNVDGGMCINATTCPVCTGNEEISGCAHPCPPTCQEPNLICNFLVCNTGCVCKKGYIRKYPGGPCILQWTCPVCTENEEISGCASPCPPTCQEPNLICNFLVCNTGCVCKEGYIRQHPGGPCILQRTC